MPFHSEPHYPLCSIDISTNEDFYRLHSSPLGTLDGSYLPDNRMVFEGSLMARPYYDCVQDSQPAALSASLAASQWSTTQGISNTPYDHTNPSSNHCFPLTTNATPYTRLNGRTSRASYCDRKSLHDPSFAYHSVTGPESGPQELKTSGIDAMNSLGPSSSSTQHIASSAYLIDSIERNPDALLLPPRYHPFSSELSGSQVPMSALFPYYESTRGSYPELSQPPKEGSLPDNYATISSDALNIYDPSDASLIANDEDSDGGLSSEPYAQLIYRALKSVPSHRMVLKEIYEWFEKNTDKAKNNSSKGWQNSIRHNLSMNGAFKKVDQNPPSEDGKKGFVWVLEQSALENGVESTTRYRKIGPNKKTNRLEPAATQRQRSGAKGGRATKKSAKMRRTGRYEESRKERLTEEPMQESKPADNLYEDNQTSLDTDLYDLSNVPYFLHTPSSTVQSSTAETSPYSFSDIRGYGSGVGSEGLFYEAYEDGVFDQTLSSQSFCDSEHHRTGCDFGNIV